LPAKTSIVFVLPDNNPGGLYKALSCFSLRELDCSKIESRPTSLQLLENLQHKQQRTFDSSKTNIKVETASTTTTSTSSSSSPRFRYTFYLDFLASELDDRSQNALLHLKEQAQFVRVLGSFPKSSQLIGPIKLSLNTLSRIPVTTEYPSIPVPNYPSRQKKPPLKIGIIGFGKFGQFLAKTFAKDNLVYCVNKAGV
jgi:hypothetical protein